MLTTERFFECKGPWEAHELASSGILVINLVLPASDKGKNQANAQVLGTKSAAKYASWDPSQRTYH